MGSLSPLRNLTSGMKYQELINTSKVYHGCTAQRSSASSVIFSRNKNFNIFLPDLSRDNELIFLNGPTGDYPNIWDFLNLKVSFAFQSIN